MEDSTGFLFTWHVSIARLEAVGREEVDGRAQNGS